jgi:hypothetical protein
MIMFGSLKWPVLAQANVRHLHCWTRLFWLGKYWWAKQYLHSGHTACKILLYIGARSLALARMSADHCAQIRRTGPKISPRIFQAAVPGLPLFVRPKFSAVH